MRFQKEWLLNPFRRIAGAEALMLGAGFMLATALVAWPARTHFDGVLDVHVGKTTPAGFYFLEPVINWGVAFTVFYLVARIGSGSRFRAIDLAGTLALSRAPMLLAAPVGFMITGTVDPMHPGPEVFLSALPLLLCGIWMITLMFWAFRISVNPKPARATLLFVVALLLAEVVSSIIFVIIYKNLLS